MMINAASLAAKAVEHSTSQDKLSMIFLALVILALIVLIAAVGSRSNRRGKK